MSFGLSLFLPGLQQYFQILQWVCHAGMDITELAIRFSHLCAAWLEDLTRKEFRPAKTAFSGPAGCGDRNPGTFQGYHERFVGPRGNELSASYRDLEAGITRYP